MTFNSTETSASAGRPIELYEFINGNTAWYFTSAEYEISHQGKTYLPERIQRSGGKDTQELNQLAMTITVPISNQVADIFKFYPPTNITFVTVFRKHRGDPDGIVQWMGRVLNADFQGSTAELHCEPITTSIRRLGLRKYYQRECPHVLYGPDCRADRSKHEISTVARAVSGLSVLVENTKLEVDSLAGGMLSWETPLGTSWRFITSNSHDTVNINFPVRASDDYGRDLPPNTPIKLYPGCLHTVTDCTKKFKNLDNYGGFPFAPLQNPFQLTTLW